MKIQSFLEHHGIRTNPFVDEDAQTDLVFKEHCIGGIYHPAWQKIYGDPTEPATSIVFGEKGAGKTALRLQIREHLAAHNAQSPDRRLYVIEYDDFNPFLDRFRDKVAVRQRRRDRVLNEWKLWDHMDAILSLGVTRLVDQLLGQHSGRNGFSGTEPLDPSRLEPGQRRDLLLLAAFYDQSVAEPHATRWHRLRRKVRYPAWKSKWDLAVGILTVVAVVVVIIGTRNWDWLATPWPYVIAAAGGLPWVWRALRRWFMARGVVNQLRCVNLPTGQLRQVLMNFTADQLAGQPIPNRERSDDRYELLVKFQSLLAAMGYSGIIVLVDRVDEPHLINGSAEQMRALMWPMLDNKFLKHPGVGFKLLLPVELHHYLQREEQDFYQRARLDKQNMVPSLEWTGEALWDVANARLQGCGLPGKTPRLRDLFDTDVTDARLLSALQSLRVPRHVFKYFHRLIVAHCNAHTEDQPVWKIPSPTFESTLALYQRDQDAFDRGMGAG